MHDEHESLPEETLGDSLERIVPEIPGVPLHERDIENWGVLEDDPDEDSEEDVLGEISNDIRQTLVQAGVEGLNRVGDDELIQLWYRMNMNQHLIIDLLLTTLCAKQEKMENSFARLHAKDLLDRADVLINPYDARIEMLEIAGPGLQRLGYSDFDAYRLPRHGDEEIAQAYKVEGWLASQPQMSDLPDQLRSGILASPTGTLKPSQLFRITLDEIIRQGHIVTGEEFRKNFDERIGYESQAYEEIKTSLRNMYQLANLSLIKFAAPQR